MEIQEGQRLGDTTHQVLPIEVPEQERREGLGGGEGE